MRAGIYFIISLKNGREKKVAYEDIPKKWRGRMSEYFDWLRNRD